MNRMPWWAVAVAMCASIVAGRDHVEEMPLSPERAEMARVFARAWTSENNSVGIYSGPTLDDIDYNYGGKNFPDVLEMNQRGYEPMLLRTRLKGNPPELFYYNSVELRGQTPLPQELRGQTPLPQLFNFSTLQLFRRCPAQAPSPVSA